MINVACVGAGYWGKNLIRNFYATGVLHTICDGEPERLAKFSQQYPDVRATLDFESVVTDSQVNAISIATPAETHYELIMRSLAAGKHVFCEKPVCLNESDAERCIDMASEKGVVLMVGHLLWYHPMVLEMKRAISGGELGKLRYIYSNRLNMGLLRSEENVLWSFGPHDISMILGLVGEEPISFKAHGSNHLNPEIADQVVGLLEFPGNIAAHIFVSWLNPFKEQKLVVVGEEAMMVFDDTKPWNEKLAKYNHAVEWSHGRPVAVKAEPEYVDLPQSEPLKNECLHFVESVKNNKTPRTDGEEGLRVLKVLNELQSAMEH